MSQLSEDQLDEMIDRERLREPAPLNEWRTIAARARDEGLLRESDTNRIWGSAQPWLQAAAAVLILVGGIAIGRTTIALPSSASSVATTESVSPPADSPAAAVVAPASSTTLGFSSVEEASAALNRALTDYQRASRFLAANNASGGTRDSLAIYAARAEALDKIVNATERAMQTAPHDPVINQYYLATMGARVATEQMVARPVVLKGF
ncbi:MAG TPA: hypothetical protein VFP77_13580 [Gemmatimonadaceae bacterium]|nr:hypothetical protein [Gemmatimonadaceae bacterium]